MKNVNLLKLAKVLMMLPMLVFLVNCSKSSKNEGNRGGYYMANGQCYGPGNQIAPMQYCQQGGIGNPGYPGQPGYPGYGQACDGIYWYQGQPVQCFAQTRNCAGYTLQQNISPNPGQVGQPGQTVQCQ